MQDSRHTAAPAGTVRSADGTSIAFDRTGEGPALVLVVGAFCDRTVSRPLTALLAHRFTVYEYDRRGRGGSGDAPDYAVDREIEDLAAVIEATGGGAFLYGHSSGAVLALEAAACGVPVAGIVAYEPPLMADPAARAPDDLLARMRAMVAAGRRDDVIVAFLTEALRVPAPAVTAMRADPSWTRREALAHTLPYDLAICDQPLPLDRMARVRARTLVAAGGASPAWARETAQALAAAIRGGETLTLEGQDHGVENAVMAPILEERFR